METLSIPKSSYTNQKIALFTHTMAIFKQEQSMYIKASYFILIVYISPLSSMSDLPSLDDQDIVAAAVLKILNQQLSKSPLSSHEIKFWQTQGIPVESYHPLAIPYEWLCSAMTRKQLFELAPSIGLNFYQALKIVSKKDMDQLEKVPK